MLSGRPGAVAVEMAWDAMASSAYVEPLGAAAIRDRAGTLASGGGGSRQADRRRPAANDHDWQRRAACRRGRARSGRGIRCARGRLPRRTRRGAEDHALGISSYAAFRLWPETDALIGIGTRVEMPYMRWTGMMTLRRPAAGAAASHPHRYRPGGDATAGAARRHRGGRDAGTRALLAAVRRLRGRKKLRPSQDGKRGAVRPRRRRQGRGARGYEKVQPQLAYLDVIRKVLPRDGVLVIEVNQMGFTSYFGYPVYAPRTYVSEGYQGTLGFGFPTALGVKVAHPDEPVISVTGDGGFMFAVQELATAAQYGIALVTLAVQQRVLRQRPARPAHGLRQSRDRLGARQSRFHAAGEGLRRRGPSRIVARRPGARAGEGHPHGPAGPDRDRGAPGQRGLALGVHPSPGSSEPIMI